MDADRSLGLPRGETLVRDFDPRWLGEYALEEAGLGSLLGELAVAVEHVGSTSVPGLAAKPIIDVAVVVRDRDALGRAVERLVAAGYDDRGDAGEHGGVVVVKGSDSSRTHHLHLLVAGDPQFGRYLAFRDALRRDDALRDRYAELKRDLADRYPRDRPAYLHAKREFISKAIGRAVGDGTDGAPIVPSCRRD